MEAQHKRSTFTGSIGFVLAAAGSAVGLGNIWRFPYLAAKDGGGVFLLCYVILALTFGFTLLTTEIAIGRKTGQSPLTAYGKLSKRWGWIGVLACIIPHADSAVLQCDRRMGIEVFVGLSYRRRGCSSRRQLF